MSAVQIGPLVLAIDRFAAIAAIMLFMIAIEIMARLRPHVADPLRRWSGWTLVLGLTAGRAGHVAVHWTSFAIEPLRALAFWQGGFSVQTALVVVVVVTAIAAGRVRGLIGPAVACLAFGIVLWQGIMISAGPVAPLQAHAGRLQTIDGAGFDLAEHAGRPVVLNLWATWCAPCRRELPMMADVASRTEGVTFAFASQREPAQRVANFLATERIRLPTVILDTDGRLAQHYASLGLPATLFLNAEGKLVSLHIGEISRERFEAEIAALMADLVARPLRSP